MTLKVARKIKVKLIVLHNKTMRELTNISKSLKCNRDWHIKIIPLKSQRTLIAAADFEQL
jgi:hypothetical protein